jgi:hypothetical protein
MSEQPRIRDRRGSLRSAGRRPLRSAVLTAALLALAGSPLRPARAAPGHEGAGAASQPARTAVVTDPAGLEARYGIRVQHVALTGGGGLVDLRFTVLDPSLARKVLDGHAGAPRIVVEGGGVELQAPEHGGLRHVKVQKDAACFVLFPNARGAVKAGTRVAVAFGDVRVSPVVAR